MPWDARGRDRARERARRAHGTCATHASPSTRDMLYPPLWRRLQLGSLDPARLLVVGHGRSSRVVADGQALDHDEVILDEDGAELGEKGLEGESGGGVVAAFRALAAGDG